MKKKKIASRIWGIITIILAVSVIILLLCPTISKIINKERADRLIDEFNDVISSINYSVPSTETNDIYENQPEKAEKQESRTPALSGTELTGDQDVSIDYYADDYIFQDEYIVYNTDYAITTKSLDTLYQDSVEYNNSLKARQSFDGIDFSVSALNLYDYGIYNDIYGYICIPDIDLQMPILLGASKPNMAAGVTHLYGTSLPIGGESTNCVLAGHTGATGRIFFDDIPNLQPGSVITVTTLFDKQDYAVDSIKKIDITQTNDLYIEKGKDKLTLLTCADSGTKRWQVSCSKKEKSK